MRLLILFFLIGISANLSKAQSTPEEIDFYGDVMIYAYEQDHRMKAAEKFYAGFSEYLQANGIETDLSWNPWVSVLENEDKSFRVISWEVKETEEKYYYYGFIQFSSGKLIELKGGEEYWTKISYESRSIDDWPQALYYNLKQVSDSTYLLFGINRFNAFENVKLAEPIIISNDDITFGAPIFTHPDGDVKYRLVLQYADDAAITLNYNESLGLLIFDHLISRMGRIPGQGVTMLPDGSYEAYEFKDGIWVYIEKVFDHIYDETPIPMPKSKKSSKDLFGRDKN